MTTHQDELDAANAIIRNAIAARGSREAFPREFPDYPIALTANPMTSVYGVTEGVQCRGCVFLVTTIARRSIFKCEKRRMSHSATTDHRKSWPACGLYTPRPPQ